MKLLKNWDNKTWLSSVKYISSFHNFLKSKININKKTTILDIGCGRANLIYFLEKKYKFNVKPIGVDVVKNIKNKQNIIFKKKDAIKYLKSCKNNFDLILIKQTIHFFKKKEINILLNLAKKSLKKNGKIIIFFLKRNQNAIPTFKKMKIKLDLSLERDVSLIGIIEKNFKKYKKNNFKFKVSISKKTYIKMIQNRYISILLSFSEKDIKLGILEIDTK